MPHFIYRFFACGLLALSIGIGFAGKTFAEDEPGEVTQFRDWTVTCGGAGDQNRCVMVQILKQQDQEQPFLRMELQRVSGGSISGVMVAPFGLDISKGVSLSIDGGERWNLPFRTCQSFGCVVRMNIGSELVERLKKGGALDVYLYTLEGAGSLNVEVSLSGFSAAYDAL